MVESTDVVAGTNATAEQYNDLRNDIMMGKRINGTETDGATITIDWSDATKGNIRTVTLGGNRTIVFSNASVGQSILIRLVQDGTGNRTVTWPTIKWPSGQAPTLTSTANSIDAFLIFCSAASTYDGYFAGFGLS